LWLRHPPRKRHRFKLAEGRPLSMLLGDEKNACPPLLSALRTVGGGESNLASLPVRSSWFGRCRLLACITNVVMILAMYAEYLHAADWPEIPARCDQRHQLPWVDFCDCYHRYTFSHAMLRGQNLTVFGVVGTIVAICFFGVEHQRVTRLQSLLQALLEDISAIDGKGDTNDTSIEGARYALRCLPVYSLLIRAAFVGVLLLVPFHLERPRLHYASTALAAGSMFLGVCIYASIPLGQAVGLSGGDIAIQQPIKDDLLMWAQRHHLLRICAGCVIAMHFVLPATAAMHHFAWIDTTGRLFGACEVLTILSYQVFVAFFAIDDFAIHDQATDKSSDATITKAVLCKGD